MKVAKRFDRDELFELMKIRSAKGMTFREIAKEMNVDRNVFTTYLSQDRRDELKIMCAEYQNANTPSIILRKKAAAIEAFVSNPNRTLQDIADELFTNIVFVTGAVGEYFPVKRGDDTEVITKQSKINEREEDSQLKAA